MWVHHSGVDIVTLNRCFQKRLIRRSAQLQHLRFQMADIAALTQKVLLPFRVLFGEEINLPIAHSLVDFKRTQLAAKLLHLGAGLLAFSFVHLGTPRFERVRTGSDRFVHGAHRFGLVHTGLHRFGQTLALRLKLKLGLDFD